jgi:hypothetical protein
VVRKSALPARRTRELLALAKSDDVIESAKWASESKKPIECSRAIPDVRRGHSQL